MLIRFKKGWRGHAAGSLDRRLTLGVKRTLIMAGIAEEIGDDRHETAAQIHVPELVVRKRGRPRKTQ